MRWFERHLNWSFFFGCFLIPTVISFIVNLIFIPQFYVRTIALINAGASESELQTYTLTTILQFIPVFSIVLLVLWIFIFIVTWWYLGKKARSRWFILLHFVPFGIIALLLLGNRSTGFGGDFVPEPATDQWSVGGQNGGGYDERQLKELDYTPSQNVLDISGVEQVKEIMATSDVPGSESSGTVPEAAKETPAPEKPIERTVSRERLKMPILLDDTGTVIHCFYHPGADAVNLCSRCKQYVCVECNYVTGTHPICRNCWEKRAEIPVAPPPQKVSRAPVKPEKQKVDKVPLPTELEEHKVAELARPEKLEVREPVSEAPRQPEVPVVTELIPPAETKEVLAGKPEKQKVVEAVRSAKQETERNEWQQGFMALYRQASPIINVIIRRDTEGMPASPLDLMEGLKLRPILELVKKLSKPKDKDMREAKSELEHLMSGCIKIADTAADFISGGGQALLGGPDFKHIVDGIETANELMDKLSQKLPSFSRPQE